jgi:hypothetical protein
MIEVHMLVLNHRNARCNNKSSYNIFCIAVVILIYNFHFTFSDT